MPALNNLMSQKIQLKSTFPRGVFSLCAFRPLCLLEIHSISWKPLAELPVVISDHEYLGIAILLERHMGNPGICLLTRYPIICPII
jgi:hypothetical protein